MRLIRWVIVILLVAPTLARAQSAGAGAANAVLDVVIDSVLGGALGSYGTSPVLRYAVLEHASISRPITVSNGQIGESRHDPDWFTSQLKRPAVLGACLKGGVFGCRLSPTTSVVAISRPRFADATTATVQVYVRRPTGGGPGGQGTYAGQWLMTLSRGEESWVLTEVRNIGIT